MKLLEMLIAELPALGGLPEGAEWIRQSEYDGELYFYDKDSEMMGDFRGLKMSEIDKESPEITKDQYLASLAALGETK